MIKIEDYSKNDKRYTSAIKILPVFILIAICLLGVGYASLNAINLEISGTLGATLQKNIFISRVVDTSENEINGTYNNTILNSTITLDSEDLESTKTYTVTICNNTNYAYEYIETIDNPMCYSNTDIIYTLSGIEENEIIQAHTNKTFQIEFKYKEDITEITENSLTSTIRFVFENSIDNFDLSQIIPNQKFNLGEVDFDANNQTFYIEMDVNGITETTDKKENLISIGQYISEWDIPSTISGGVNLHIYYPSNQQMIISLSMQDFKHLQYKKSYSKIKDDGIIKLAFNSNGLYINGEKIIDSDGTGEGTIFFSNLSTKTEEEYLQLYFQRWSAGILDVEVGSEQGVNRSTAQYRDVKIYKSLLDDEGMIQLTKIRENKPLEEITFEEILDKPAYSPLPYCPGGNMFDFDVGNFNNIRIQTLYAEIDMSNIVASRRKENILSMGHDIQRWQPTIEGTVNIHFYYPEYPNENDPNEEEHLILAITNKSNFAQWRFPVSILNVVDGKMKIAININGIYINGVKIASYAGIGSGADQIRNPNGSLSNFLISSFGSFTNAENNIQVGSKEGINRSTANYDKVRIYNGLVTEEDMITLTSLSTSL